MKTERQRAINRLDRKFSQMVRQRDADKNGLTKCCTCGKIAHWKEMHLGHFMSRRYLSIRWEVKNTGVQCPACNTFNQGEQFKFSKYLDERYGEGTSDLMLIKSKNITKLTVFELKELEKILFDNQ